MKIEQFISVLCDRGLELGSQEILDALWLAAQVRRLALYAPYQAPVLGSAPPKSKPPTVQDPPPKEETRPEDRRNQGEYDQQKASKNEEERVDTQPVREQDTTEVYARGAPSAGDRTIRASPVAVPAGRALSNRLALMRALRPLRENWSSRQDQDLDEELTAESTADLGGDLSQFVYPAFQPRQERWFVVDVIREDDAAIELWEETIRDFCELLRDTGAFRIVRSFRLKLPKVGPIGTDGLRSAMLETPTGVRVSIRALTGRGARRLIFFVTHGSSSRWLDGSYARVLASWIHDCSIVLLHLMPRARWQHTPLGDPHGLCAAPQPGATSAELRIDRFWWALPSEPDTRSLLTIPAISVDATAISEWAHMQMARGRRCPAFVIDALLADVAWRSELGRSAIRDVERAIANLRAVSSEAYQLAVYLSSSAFTIPVARLIQKAKFGDAADQSDLAELFLSGLVTVRQQTADEQIRADAFFEFLPEARRILTRSLLRSEAHTVAEELRRQVSRYIEKISGSPFTFQALISDRMGIYRLPRWAQPFADVALSLLGLPAAPVPSNIAFVPDGDRPSSTTSAVSAADRADAVLEIDLAGIVANWRLLTRKAKPAGCGAVVKAHAYGLGAPQVSVALAAAGCRLFFVATLDEGISLRSALPEIVVLDGPLPGSAEEFVSYRLIPVLNEPGQIADWTKIATRQRGLPAMLHIDTGMAFLGLTMSQFEAAADGLREQSGIHWRALISELACADQPEHPMNEIQRARFVSARSRFGMTHASLAASSGIFLGSQFHFDFVRPGAALYGVNPQPGAPNPMRQVIHLKGRILQVREVNRGDSVGYGASHVMDAPGRLATVAVGYADGWRRSFSGRGFARLGGAQVPLVGRVSMDLAVFDVSATDPSLARPGEFIELLGSDHTIEAAAAEAGMIEHEILAALGRRYHRIYRGMPFLGAPST